MSVLLSPGAIARFFTKFEVVPSGCWEWRKRLDLDGYGVLREGRPRRKNVRAHRASYLIHKGSIPPDFTIDHLCRNRACVNPAHLEAVTRKENILRGVGPTAVNAAKTHCVRGHEFTPENTLTRAGRRNCRTCKRAWDRDRLKRIREGRLAPTQTTNGTAAVLSGARGGATGGTA